MSLSVIRGENKTDTRLFRGCIREDLIRAIEEKAPEKGEQILEAIEDQLWTHSAKLITFKTMDFVKKLFYKIENEWKNKGML